jgi:hypothetical protein
MKEGKISLKRAFNKAEEKAKERDNATRTINVRGITTEAEKAQKLGYGIYKLRKINAAPFVQSNANNLQFLISTGYLTDPEWNVSSKIQTLCELNTNAIIDPQTKQFMNVSEIAQFLKRDRVAVGKLLNALLRKGVLYEIVNSQEIREHGRPVTERPLYMNPELYYAGNRNQVNAILSKICISSDFLEKKGIKLSWKIWYESGEKFGKLITRHTYLKYLKKAKDAKRKGTPLNLVQTKSAGAKGQK